VARLCGEDAVLPVEDLPADGMLDAGLVREFEDASPYGEIDSASCPDTADFFTFVMNNPIPTPITSVINGVADILMVYWVNLL
jgi:hypothetical protein